MPEFYRSSVEWNPSAVVALATSADGLRVAAARSDGSVEIWLVSPGSIGWHCQLIIHGDPNSRVSSLVWCRSGPGYESSVGRLLSSSIDGSVSEWDFLNLRQKIVLDSVGVSIWQIAAEPCNNFQLNLNPESKSCDESYTPSECSEIDELVQSDSDDDGESTYAVELLEDDDTENTRLALACDDGCVRIYCILDAEKLTYRRALPRVNGRALSVTWSPDATRIYSGSSDGNANVIVV